MTGQKKLEILKKTALTNFPEIVLKEDQWLDLEMFKQMDYYAVEQYNLPIELMMENAGLNLAILVAKSSDPDADIVIGVGNGNNGGGGLVAARRLAAWGYKVFLDMPLAVEQDLPHKQLQRALDFGVTVDTPHNPGIWVDAYLGFSQRLPLPQEIANSIKKANESSALRISLDLPTGYLGQGSVDYFNPNKTLILASAKKILKEIDSELFVADLGIPKEVYEKFNSEILPFYNSTILKITKT